MIQSGATHFLVFTKIHKFIYKMDGLKYRQNKFVSVSVMTLSIHDRHHLRNHLFLNWFLVDAASKPSVCKFRMDCSYFISSNELQTRTLGSADALTWSYSQQKAHC